MKKKSSNIVKECKHEMRSGSGLSRKKEFVDASYNLQKKRTKRGTSHPKLRLRGSSSTHHHPYHFLHPVIARQRQ